MTEQDQKILDTFKTPGQENLALRLLIDTYKERLYWHIRRIVLNHEDTDDVLQNTFIKVYRNLKNFKGESKLYSWMYRIATNEALSFLKKRSRELSISSESLQEQIVSNLKADPYFEGDEIQLKLQQAIAQLPEKQRLVFNMKYYENLTYDQISQALDTSVGALKASYHIAVKKMEVILRKASET